MTFSPDKNWPDNKLYRLPQEGMIKGVCAGLARYFDVPVKLVRLIAVLSCFFGLFFITIAAYIILCFALDPAPASEPRAAAPNRLLDEADALLNASEQRLRSIERYITSDTYSVRNKFRQL